MRNFLKEFLNQIGAWTIKHHWIFLLLIIGLQWLTGTIMQKPTQYLWLMDAELARRLHILNSQLIFYLLIYMAFNKLWLWLKRAGKV